MARDKYEISLWKDVMVAANGNIPAHFEEEKIAVIGSNTMTAACRAYEPKLVENINGTNTFTFKMFYTYRDEQTGEKKANSYLGLLVNERKIKVLWKDKWYDLVIKNIQEDSNGKSITYTCKDLFINELSKNGFNLEFDNELENNQGDVLQLAHEILDGTDWQVDDEYSDIVKQEKEEPLYSIIIKTNITATNDKTGVPYIISADANHPKIVYVFYSCVQNQTPICQFLYDETQQYNRDTNSQLIINVPCYSISTTWTEYNDHPPVPDALTTIKADMGSQVSNDFRGSRLVDSNKTIFDPLTDKYVTIYKASRAGVGYDEDDEIYEYEATEYRDATVVNNLIVNNSNFAGFEGWIYTDSSDAVGPIKLSPMNGNVPAANAKSYLQLGLNSSCTIYNAGLIESSSYIPDGIQAKEKYVFRYKARANNNGAPGVYINNTDNPIIPSIRNYNTSTYTPENNSYLTVDSDFEVVDGWVECLCECSKSFSRDQISDLHIGFFCTVPIIYWIEEIQFFPYVEGIKINTTTTGRINPGEMDWSSKAQVYYHYYNHTANDDASVLNEYLYVSTDPWNNTDLVLQTNNFTKIRSITAKQSNRFNLLQTVAETFECWCKFEIEHDQATGKTIYIDGVPQKHVIFKENIGQDVGYGFIYGVDLKTISRTIQSDQIVTKTIVLQNSNEFGTDGFCTIARSPENYARDTFILNFDYYLTQGLLDSGELNKDLYSQFNGNTSQGYYTQLHYLNIAYDDQTEILMQRKNDLVKQKSYQTVYQNYYQSLLEEENNLVNYILSLASATTWAGAEVFIRENPNFLELQNRLIALQNCRSNKQSYLNMLDSITNSIETIEEEISDAATAQTSALNSIKALNAAFYKKYAHYIQEGSWNKEDYIDDTLYYLDALSVACTSSRPQISYNISVARLSSLEEFKSKVFHLGDISYIQDTEFFGYVNINGLQTPYKEKVLISEITSNFDDPIQDNFKVQNYKTQFEDLFQRITATTQSLQYASGEYNRAASIVDTNGNIKIETLQSSIAYNNNLVIQANNEQIFQDSTGITVTDATNPNKRTKITSGGVFISTDGGATWKNAIRGEGIATQYLTAGNINTQYITLLDGDHTAFRWDSTGINAYATKTTIQEDETHVTSVDLSTFVRFDKYGIYGISHYNGETPTFIPSGESDIWDTAAFGLTWQGLFIKNRYGDHYVEVSSTDDIQVVDTVHTTQDFPNGVPRVKIGQIGGAGSISDPYQYGIVIRDNGGNPVLITQDDGKLWLRNKLSVGNGTTSTVSIGYDPNITRTGTQYHEVIHAGSGNTEFIVYEDGYIKASGGTFTGAIEATSGTFHGTITAGSIITPSVTIGVGGPAISEIAYHVIIESSNGLIFKDATNQTTLTATLYNGTTPVTPTTGFNYEWYKDNSATVIARTQSITVNSSDVPITATYKCIIKVPEGDA